MPEVSEKSKGIFGKIMGLFNGQSKDSIGENSSSTELLSGIYKMIVQREDFRKQEYKENLKSDKAEERLVEKRHKEILKALTVKRPKKVVEEKKKEEPSKLPEKPGEPPKAETSKTTPKVEPAKTEPAAPAPKVEPPKPTATPAPAPKPTVTPAPAAPAPSLPTAAKVITGVAVSSLLAGKESLAANIAKYESKGSSGKSFGGNEYNAYNKGTVGNKMIPADENIDFSKMTIEEYLRRGRLKSGDPQKIFAVGRYQIIPDTMENLVKKMKIDPKTTYLDAPTQDMLFSKGLIGSKRKKVEAYLNGTSNDRDAAILELAQEFASVGVPYDIEVKGKTIKKGTSYYSGVGGNKAHNSPEEVGAALDADRIKNLSTPVIPDNKIQEMTIENNGIKKELNDQSAMSQTTNNITMNNSETSQTPSSKVDDRSAFERKRTE
jgi:hypothetical protein